MIQIKINNSVSIVIFPLYIKMLSSHKKVEMVLEMKFQDKTKSKRYSCAIQKNDSRKALLLKVQTFKVLNRDNSDYVTRNSWKPLFPKNRKPLNCNFDVRFCVSLKTAFPKLSRNITTC